MFIYIRKKYESKIIFVYKKTKTNVIFKINLLLISELNTNVSKFGALIEIENLRLLVTLLFIAF
jgi:hypothetical protein